MADGDFNLATLWVSVVPEVSQVGQKIEDAGEDAKRRWTDKVKDFGKTITDDLEKAGERTKEIFTKAGSDGSQAMSDSFKESGSSRWKDLAHEAGQQLGGELGHTLGEAFKSTDVGQKVGDFFDNVKGAAGVAQSSISGIGEAIRNAKVGDFAGAIGGLSGALQTADPLAKTFGIDISGLTGPLQDVLSKTQGIAGPLKDVTGLFGGIAKDAPGIMGAFGGIAASIGELAGPLAAATAASEALIESTNKLTNQQTNVDPHQNPHGWWGTGFGILGGPLQHLFGGGGGDQGSSGTPQPSAPGNTPYDDHMRNLFGVGGAPTGGTPGGGSSGTPLPPLPTTAPSAFTSPSGTNWDSVAGGESGGNWGIETGNGFSGGLQFTQSSWEAAGGLAFAPRASMATPDQQKTAAEKLLAMQGPGAWPNTYHLGAPGSGGGGSTTSSAPASMPTGGGSGMPDFSAAGQPYGLPGGSSVDYGAPGFPSWVYQLASKFGLRASTYPGHQESNRAEAGYAPDPQHLNRGIDWQGSPEAMQSFADYVSTVPGMEQVIFQNPASGQRTGIAGGRPAPSGYYSKDFPEHTGHVHTRQSSEIPLPGARSSSAGNIPIGTEHDPIYVTTPSTGGGGGGGGSPGENAGQQLGQGLLSGLAQSVGLDGSVFGGKSPMDWGAVKMGMGVLNWGLGVAKQHAGAESGTSMMGGGGGGMGGMLGGLIPGPGAAMSAAAMPAGGSRGIGAATGGSGDQNVHYDNSINVSGNNFTPQNPMLQQLQHQQNSRTAGIMGSLPAPPG